MSVHLPLCRIASPNLPASRAENPLFWILINETVSANGKCGEYLFLHFPPPVTMLLISLTSSTICLSYLSAYVSRAYSPIHTYGLIDPSYYVMQSFLFVWLDVVWCSAACTITEEGVLVGLPGFSGFYKTHVNDKLYKTFQEPAHEPDFINLCVFAVPCSNCSLVK